MWDRSRNTHTQCLMESRGWDGSTKKWQKLSGQPLPGRRWPPTKTPGVLLRRGIEPGGRRSKAAPVASYHAGEQLPLDQPDHARLRLRACPVARGRPAPSLYACLGSETAAACCCLPSRRSMISSPGLSRHLPYLSRAHAASRRDSPSVLDMDVSLPPLPAPPLCSLPPGLLHRRSRSEWDHC